jgi:hypothetical protein
VGVYGLDSFDSGQGQVARICVEGDEHSGFIEGGGFLE